MKDFRVKRRVSIWFPAEFAFQQNNSMSFSHLGLEAFMVEEDIRHLPLLWHGLLKSFWD